METPLRQRPSLSPQPNLNPLILSNRPPFAPRLLPRVKRSQHRLLKIQRRRKGSLPLRSSRRKETYVFCHALDSNHRGMLFNLGMNSECFVLLKFVPNQYCYLLQVAIESSPTFAPGPLDLQSVPEVEREDSGEVEEQVEVVLPLTILPFLEPASELTPSDVVAGVLGQIIPIEGVTDSEGEGATSPPELSPEPVGEAEPSSPPQAQILPPVAEPVFQIPPATASTPDSRAHFYERIVSSLPSLHLKLASTVAYIRSSPIFPTFPRTRRIFSVRSWRRLVTFSKRP